MADELSNPPDHSLGSAKGTRDGKPSLSLVRFFQIKEADYMKPPLQEQLMEPDGGIAPTPGTTLVQGGTSCTCNVVCTCVPVSICACNTVCTCNMVSSTYARVEVPTPPVVTTPCSHSTEPVRPPACRHTTRPPVRPPSCRHVTGGGGSGGYGGYWAPCF